MEKVVNSQPSLFMFLGVGLALGTSSFIAVAVQNIFPYIAGSLATSDHHAVWVLTFMVMNWAIGSTLMPWVSARKGLRGAFNLSLFSLIVSSAVCATTSNIWIMLLFRGVQGIGAGIMVPLSQTIFIRYCSPARRILMMSLWTNAMLIPFYIGPFIGGWLATVASWRYIFIFSIPLFMMSMFLSGRKIPNSVRLKKPFDSIGFVLLYGFVVSLQFIIDQGDDSGWFRSGRIDIALFLAITLLIAFIFWQKRAEHALLNLSFLKIRSYWLGLILLCLGWAMFTGWTADIPLWVEKYTGYNGFYGGLLSVPIGATAIPITIFMSRASRWMPINYLAGLSFLVFSTVYASIFLAPQESLHTVILYMALIGIGIGLLFVPMNMLVLSEVSAENLHEASTLANFVRTLSSSMGVGILGGLSYNATGTAYDVLRGHISWFGSVPNTSVGIQFYLHDALLVAATMGINNVIRISAWVCLAAAIVALWLIKTPQTKDDIACE